MLNTLRSATRPATVALPRPVALDGLVLIAAAAVAFYGAYLITDGYGPLLIAAVVGGAAFIGILLRPEVALVVWICALFSYGGTFTRTAVGPVYATEVLLFALASALAVRLLFGSERRPGFRYTLALAALLWVPGVASLLLKTALRDPDWMREFAIIHYSLFAAVAAAFYSPRIVRVLGIAVVGSAIFGLGWVLLRGGFVHTSTGAVRIAAGSHAIGFGVAPLIIVAAVREGLARKRWLLLALLILVGLVFVSHRSAWIGFALAITLLLFSRPSASPRIALIGAVAALLLVFTTAYLVKPDSQVGDLVVRAQAVSDTNEPNALYRLRFWEALARESMRSPLIGNGFDPYPERLLPPSTTAGDVSHAPHNSFIALMYRIGPIFLSLVSAALLLLVMRGFRAGRTTADPLTRAIRTALAASVVYVGVFTFFNVVLESPYMAVPFWVAVGLLAAAVSAEAPRGDPRLFTDQTRSS